MRAKIIFLMFLTIFAWAESNAERCYAQLFMQRLEFYDLELASRITQQEHRGRVW